MDKAQATSAEKIASLVRAEEAEASLTALSLRQKIAILVFTVLCIVISVIVFAPVAWLNGYVQSQTNGRVALINADGGLWNGSALIGVAVDKSSELSPIVPGRFTWRVSPILLLGQVELVLTNPKALQRPLYITGNSKHIQISPGSLTLPASRLVAIGAPINTIKPTGDMTLSWDALGLNVDAMHVDINGTLKLAMHDIGSALSQVKPLGSYLLTLVWHGSNADIGLKTKQGPLLLSGEGKMVNWHLQFEGTARAEPEQEENLANLLNLLGQRRPGADKNVIALEFK